MCPSSSARTWSVTGLASSRQRGTSAAMGLTPKRRQRSSREVVATMEVSAVQKFVRRTPRKARLVADSVKGLKVSEALAYLEFSPKHAARDVAKALKSAASNAEHNVNLHRIDPVLN